MSGPLMTGSVPTHRFLLLVLRSLQAMLRGASAGPRALAAQLVCRSSSGAAEAGRPSRDKRRRRTRRQTKRSMWREIQRQDRRFRTMRACCEEASSDDDDHNTGDSLLLLCAHALVGSVLPSDMSEADELLVAQRLQGGGTGPSFRGLSLQHGWTCTRLCLDLSLTMTFVKAYVVLISFFSSIVLAESLSDCLTRST